MNAPDDAAMTLTLTLLLPLRIFAEHRQVRRIIAETSAGSLGLLPRRRDCVAPLRAGVLLIDDGAGIHYVALDQGMLFKTGNRVTVATRHAVAGTDLALLRRRVEQEFLDLDRGERELRAVLARLEAGIVRRLVSFGGAP